MKARLDYHLLFLRTRTSRGTLKRTQDLGEKRHTLQPGTLLTWHRIGAKLLQEIQYIDQELIVFEHFLLLKCLFIKAIVKI